MFDTVEKYRGLFKILLILIALSFVTFTAHSFSAGSGDYIVKVGEQTVSERDVDEIIRNNNLNNDEATRLQVLEVLTGQAYLLSGAQDLGLSMSDEQVKKIITGAPQFQENGAFAQKKFDEYLRNTNQSEAEFVEMLRKDYYTRTVAGLIGLPMIFSQAQAKTALQIFATEREVQAMNFDPAHFADKVTADDAQVEKFYQQNQKSYFLPQAVKFDYVRVSADDLASKQEVSAQEIQAAVDAGAASDAAKGQIQLEKASRSLSVLKENIAEAAFNDNADLTSAAKAAGVSVSNFDEWMTQEVAKMRLPEAVAAALFSDDVLIQGNNSDVIDDGKGALWVVRVKQVREAKAQDFAEIKDNVKKDFIAEESLRLAQDAAKNAMAKLEKGETPENAAWGDAQSLTVLQAKTAFPPELYQKFIAARPQENKPVYILFADIPQQAPAVLRINSLHTPEFAPEIIQSAQSQLAQMSSENNMMDYLLYMKNKIKAEKGNQKITAQEAE